MHIQIFRKGAHVAASGERLTFSDDDLAASVRAYDPSLHEAPLVVGHPEDDAPAYGWVQSLEYDGVLRALPHQVDPQFAELVRAGRYKKVSASFYRPGAAGNPSPGVYYLRHVGFLGAAAPAVKGLKNAEFNDSDSDFVEFAWLERENASLWQSLRDWIIDKFSLEEADRVVPSWRVETLQREAAVEESETSTSYSEETTTVKTEDQKRLEQRRTELDERERKLKEQETSFTEREQKLTDRERAERDTAAADYVEGLVKAGKIMPRHQAPLAALIASLPATAIEFSEGDAQKTVEPEKVLRDVLDALPSQIDYGERAGADRRAPGGELPSPKELARRAQKRVNEAEADGRSISYTEAMAEVYADAGLKPDGSPAD